MKLINDLGRHTFTYKDEIAKAVATVIDSGWFVLGPETAAFENEFSAYLTAAKSARAGNASATLRTALKDYAGVADRLWHTSADELDRLLASEDAVVLVNSERTWETGQYLQAHAQLIPGDTYPNVVQYRAWDVKDDEIEHPLALNFGDVATLRGYALEDNTTLILYWEAIAQTEGEFSVLVHIDSAPDAPPVAVLDHAIAGAVISTRTWSAGTVYRDPIALPIDLPAGELTIRVGLKDANGDPIPLDDAPDGRYPLTTIEN